MSSQTLEGALNPNRKLFFWLAVVLLAATAVVFAKVTQFGFVDYDDAGNIFSNPHIQKGLNRDSLYWMFTDSNYARRYMPIGWFCYAMNIELFGLNPQAFHIGNLILHSTNGILLFLLLCRLLSRLEGRESPANLCFAGLGALFWSINPLRVEPVAWASAQIYGLAFFLVMVWLLAWLRSIDDGRPQRERTMFRWIAIGAYALSLLTYPLAVFAPVALLILNVSPLRRVGSRFRDWLNPGVRHVWLETLPYFMVSAVFLALIAYARATSGGEQIQLLEDMGSLRRSMQVFYVWAYYLWKPWWPTDLSISYSTLHAFDPWEAKFILSLLLVVGVTLGVCFWRRFAGVSGLWWIHLIVLIPLLGLTEYPHFAYDRYSYVHDVLWAYAIAAGLRYLWVHWPSRWRLVPGIAAMAVFAAHGFMAWREVPVWQNTIALFENVIDRCGEHPSRARFDQGLANCYLQAGRTNEGCASLERAIYYEGQRADKNLYDLGVMARSRIALGYVYVTLGRVSDGVSQFEECLAADRVTAGTLTELRWMLQELGGKHPEVRELEGSIRQKQDEIRRRYLPGGVALSGANVPVTRRSD